MVIFERIWLGTVQIGMRYGFARKRPDEAQSFRMLDKAWEMGIHRFDTARAYGDAERRIGIWIKQTGNLPVLTSKVPGLARYPDTEVADIVVRSVRDSLGELGIGRIDYVLCHRCADFFRPPVRETLLRLAEDGVVGGCGVSVYSIEDAQSALGATPPPAMIQLPASVADRRVELSGIPSMASATRTQLVLRSLFLQGALMLPSTGLPDDLKTLGPVADSIRDLAGDIGITPQSLAVSYVLDAIPSASVVIGFRSARQLRDLDRLQSEAERANAIMEELRRRVRSLPASAIDPRTWNRK